MTNIAIIGAGLSGLTAANILKSRAKITIFEKSRGVGGRMSTRRDEPYFFDHGAQFFKARTDDFKKFISPMKKKGIIEHWDASFVNFKNRIIVERRNWDEHTAHYVGVPGMNAIGKYLSRNLTVGLGTRVVKIEKANDKWQLFDDQGNGLGTYDWVISTIPAQQASDLLPNSFTYHSKIASVKLRGCFSLMLGFEHPLALNFDAALVHGEDIGWISVNSSKPGRNETFCLLVHSTNKWADEHIDDDRNRVMEYLCNRTNEIIGHDVNKASHKAIQGWRYANIENQENGTHFMDKRQQLAACGDWCIKGSVEAAFTSGFKMAHQILGILKSKENYGQRPD